MTTTTTSMPTYREHVSGLLFVAFALSAIHTVYATVAGLADPAFTATSPSAWAFYILGFGLAAAARSERRAVLVTGAVTLGVLILVAVFAYPAVFTARLQNWFGWFENDVYTGLLLVAMYLTVLRLRHSPIR